MSLKEFIRGDESLSPKRMKQREVFMYLLFGGLTTLVFAIVFRLFQAIFEGKSDPFKLFLIITNTVSWIAAVTFAFLTNRAWVFKSKGPFFKEMFHFFSARIASLVLFETLLFFLMLFVFEKATGIPTKSISIDLNMIQFNWEFVIKMVNSFLAVVPANYFFSKWFVFRKKKALPENLESEPPESFGKDGADER
ncbi:MAG: GtrA family protein [Oscillospiraceae bacterium]|nr:GtrA family protein [Oscillospiraceae bacterium]